MFFDPVTLTTLLGILLTLMLGTSICSLFLYYRARTLNPMFEERERLKQEVESLHRTISDISAQISQLKDEESNAEKTIDESKYWKEWLDKNHDTISELRSQISYAQTDLKEAVDKKNKAEQDLQSKQAELQELVARNNEWYLENIKLGTNIEELKRQKESLEELVKNYETKAESANKKLKDIEQQIYYRQAELNNLDLQLEKKRQELSQKSKDYDDKIDEKNIELKNLDLQLEGKRQELSQKNKDYDDKINEKNIELKNINREIHEAERKLRDLTSRVIAVEPVKEEIRWADLNRPYITKKLSQIQKDEENDWLDNFKNNLKECGINFNDRIVNAFHTGLKVADFSPIVVLAGISGTGKSLLPQLYSHAIGMNFLQIAVQPRWDNPQDMFGFYNYMDGRYKATELSRLLWQYDIHNNKKAQEEYHKNWIRPMNMVLLDEMNLAKVEYYFSDMLSKLEVRRNIEENDDDKRRDAEIEIECGSLQDKDHARRLFIAGNTLFVGTMNEDESTQSLSNKVMDRANVLRFGKPQKLEACPDTQNFYGRYKDAVVMDYETWQENWLKSKSGNKLDDNIIRTLDKLNAELGKLDRPFAYRVFNAINSYIINYPVQNASDWKMALADQIEMKILPKLNGLDKESSNTVRTCLKNIGNIIAGIDTELASAYDIVCNDSDNVFFQWKGISR